VEPFAENQSSLRINGKEATTIAFAGVGNPLKLLDCLSSILNLASLNADAKAGKRLAYCQKSISFNK